MPAMLEPAPLRLRALLWCVHDGRAPVAPPHGRASIAVSAEADAAFCRAIGYWPLGGRAIRVDRLERLAAALRRRARAGPFRLDDRLRRIAGCSLRELAPAVEALGWRAVEAGPEDERRYARRRRRRPVVRETPAAAPFAALARLKTSCPAEP